MTRRPPRLAVLGGTFDHFHAGHRALLLAGLRAGDRLGVGVTTPEYLQRHPKPYPGRIQSYRRRASSVRRFLAARAPPDRFYIVPLEDRWGRSVEPGVGVLVASMDTRAGADSVNAERRRRGLPAVPVRLVPLVLGEDLLPISGRRVRSGAIAPDGKRRRPLRVRVISDQASDQASVAQVLRRRLPSVSVRIDFLGAPAPERSGKAVGELDREATQRAERALRGHEIGIGTVHPNRRSARVPVAVRDLSGAWREPSGVPRGRRNFSAGLDSIFRARVGERRRRDTDGINTGSPSSE